MLRSALNSTESMENLSYLWATAGSALSSCVGAMILWLFAKSFIDLRMLPFPFFYLHPATVDFHHVFDVHWNINKVDIKVSLLIPG